MHQPNNIEEERSEQARLGRCYVTMLTFNDPILLMGMRTRYAMYDANAIEKSI